jgi:hypothetical protein
MANCKTQAPIPAGFTVSPVPLYLTFSGEDIIVANTYSKSVLRAACDAVENSREHVDYFPSYVTLLDDIRLEKRPAACKKFLCQKIVEDLASRHFSRQEYKARISNKYRLNLTKRVLNFLGIHQPTTRF